MCCVELSLTGKVPTAQVIHLSRSLFIAEEGLIYAKLWAWLQSTHLHSLMLTPRVAIGDLNVLPLIRYSNKVVLPLAGPPTTSSFI